MKRSRPALLGLLVSVMAAAMGCRTAGPAEASPVETPPAAAFTFAPGAPVVAEAVAFTDTSGGAPRSWSWRFGDGATSGEQNPTHAYGAAGRYTVTLAAGNGLGSSETSRVVTVADAPAACPYPVADTGQARCYDAGAEIAAPAPGQPFYGQDAQFAGRRPSYTVAEDGLTVRDNVTGLTWQRSADANGDGAIDSRDKFTWSQAQARPAALNAARFGGFSDWRLPTIKELFSLIDFRGTDPSVSGNNTSGLTPFIDTACFRFGWGDTAAGERVIDAQYWSATPYVSTTMGGNATVFGVNFADGRIKGYPRDAGPRGASSEYLLCVRGNPAYGRNDFVDNGDGTVTDRATGLMWSRQDSAVGMNWQEALAWVQSRNAAHYLGYTDWRLPNAKELQSLVDYGRSPDTSASPAIDVAVFFCSAIVNEAGAVDYPCYWTGTTHAAADGSGAAAVYVAFGRAMGCMNGDWLDVHGAGAQRSDPKAGDPANFPTGRGPQGDAIRIFNYVRLVR